MEVGAQHPVVKQDARVLLVHQRDVVRLAAKLAVDPQLQDAVLLAGIGEPGIVLHAVPFTQPDHVGLGHFVGEPVRRARLFAQHVAEAPVAPFLEGGGHSDHRVARPPEVEVDRQICTRGGVVVAGEKKRVVRPVALGPLPTLGEEAVVAAVDFLGCLEVMVHPPALSLGWVEDSQALVTAPGCYLRRADDGKAAIARHPPNVVPTAGLQVGILEIFLKEDLAECRTNQQQQQKPCRSSHCIRLFRKDERSGSLCFILCAAVDVAPIVPPIAVIHCGF